MEGAAEIDLSAEASRLKEWQQSPAFSQSWPGWPSALRGFEYIVENCPVEVAATILSRECSYSDWLATGNSQKPYKQDSSHSTPSTEQATTDCVMGDIVREDNYLRASYASNVTASSHKARAETSAVSDHGRKEADVSRRESLESRSCSRPHSFDFFMGPGNISSAELKRACSPDWLEQSRVRLRQAAWGVVDAQQRLDLLQLQVLSSPTSEFETKKAKPSSVPTSPSSFSGRASDRLRGVQGKLLSTNPVGVPQLCRPLSAPARLTHLEDRLPPGNQAPQVQRIKNFVSRRPGCLGGDSCWKEPHEGQEGEKYAEEKEVIEQEKGNYMAALRRLGRMLQVLLSRRPSSPYHRSKSNPELSRPQFSHQEKQHSKHQSDS